jgi:pimeloyl-ACP methyl ester carboxylesterase
MPHIKVGTENERDIKIYYEDHGSGQLVVLIHGYPTTRFAADLNALMEELGLEVPSSSASRWARARSPAIWASTAPRAWRKAVLFGAIPPFLLKTDDNPEGVDVRCSSTTSTSSRRTGSASRHGRRASRSSRADPPESSATQAYEACGEAPAATLRPRGGGWTQELDVVLGSGLEHKT